MSSCPFCTKPVPSDASVCLHCLRAQPATTRASRETNALGRAVHGRGRLLLLALVAGIAGTYVVKTDRIGEIRRLRSAPVIIQGVEELDAAPAPAPPVEIMQTTIAAPLEVRVADSATVKLDAGAHLAFPFSGVSRSGCHVKGAVRVVSGGDRRVNVVVVDREGLAEVESGRAPRTYYESGPTSDVALDVNVDGRTAYTLVVINPGSRARTVRLGRIDATCAD